MTDLRTAAQQALEALEYAQQDRECPSTTRQAIAALRAALAQQAEPVQEPAYKVKVAGRWHDTEPLAPAFSLPDGEHLLYTAPPQRKQAEPLNLSDPAVRKRLATQWGYVPAAAQAEPVEPVDVGQLEYRGNSVAFIYQKMTAYRSGIDAAWDALRVNGLHPDGKTSLADMIAKYTAPPKDEPKPMHPELRKMWEDYFDKCFRAMPVPKQAEPVEPVAWMFESERNFNLVGYGGWEKRITECRPNALQNSVRNVTPLYTAPPQRKPLTEGEIEACRQQGYAHAGLGAPFDFGKAARAVERAHGIKEN